MSKTKIEDRTSYGFVTAELRELMGLRGAEGLDRVKEIGGVEEICKKLKVDPVSGLSNDGETEQRVAAFGRNYIEPKKAKSFWRLMWEAVQEITLIILMIAAVVSIILAIVGLIGNKSKSKSSTEVISNVTVSTSYQQYCVPESYAKDEDSKSHNPYIEFIEGVQPANQGRQWCRSAEPARSGLAQSSSSRSFFSNRQTHSCERNNRLQDQFQSRGRRRNW